MQLYDMTDKWIFSSCEKQEVSTKSSDPSVLFNLLKLLRDQQSQEVRSTIKGFVWRGVAPKKRGKSCTNLGKRGDGVRVGLGSVQAGVEVVEMGGRSLCTCIRAASWEKGRKQDLKLKQHPVAAPPPPSQKCLCCCSCSSLQKVGER